MIPLRIMKPERSREETIERGKAMSRRLIIFLAVLFIVVAFISTSVILKIW
jgi:hypothetical protein